jgi:chromosome segregation ATPase
MKPTIYITPLWMSLAMAISPIVHANEAPKGAQPAAPAAEANKAAEIAVPTDALAGLQKQFETMNKAIGEARTETTNVSGQRDAAIKEAQAVREAKQQLEGQLADLRKQLETSNHEVWQWKDKTKALEQKLGAGEQAFQKLASFRDEMDVAMKEFAVLKNGLADVRGELQAPAERVALKKQLDEAAASKAEVAKKLENESKALAESKRQLAASETFGKELKKAFEGLKASAKAQFEALAKAKQEREDIDRTLVATREQLEVSINENAGIVKAKAATEKDLTATRTELTATQETLAMLQKEAAQLRGTLKPLAAEIQSAKEQTTKATTAIQEASAARDKAEQARVQVEAQLKEVSGQLASAMATQSGLKEQVASKSTEIEGLRKKVEEMEAKTANQQPAKEQSQESASR